ncbi:MAG: 50S ribosomal protein L9 [Candidatus Dojkabacteria bacterium]|nr:MAG: 50S ribosomal protein L9 [Candidatus Dojkabacteria bacterium]
MAKVLLLADVQNIGRKGSIVDVKDGFASNFLFPKRLAKVASTKEIAEAAQLAMQREQFAQKKGTVAHRLSTTPQSVLVKHPVKVEVQAAAGGRVHGTVDATKVRDAAMENMPQLKYFEKSELDVKMNQRIEYVGRYATELHINITEDGKKLSYTVPLFIDIVSVSEATRKTKHAVAETK